jgi:predicted ArsR family transcriptional regulator
MGFEQDVFRLLTSTRGAGTRVALLEAMSVPKDRLQLANELGTDWNVVDRHVKILMQHGLIAEDRAYGRVKFYRMTDSGKTLLDLLKKSN